MPRFFRSELNGAGAIHARLCLAMSGKDLTRLEGVVLSMDIPEKGKTLRRGNSKLISKHTPREEMWTDEEQKAILKINLKELANRQIKEVVDLIDGRLYLVTFNGVTREYTAFVLVSDFDEGRMMPVQKNYPVYVAATILENDMLLLVTTM